MPADPNAVVPWITESKRDILVAALLGSIVSLLFMGQPFNWKHAATSIVAGLFCAYYGVEFVAGAFHLGAGSYGVLGAVFGLTSMMFLGGFFKLLRMWRDDPAGFLQEFLQMLPFFRRGRGQGGGE